MHWVHDALDMTDSSHRGANSSSIDGSFISQSNSEEEKENYELIFIENQRE